MTDIRQYDDMVSSYTFPFINTEFEYRYLKVERRGRNSEDSWAILDSPYVYQPRGRRWVYERGPSSRTDKFLKASRMPLAEALPIAERQAVNLARRWNKRLARMLARQEAARKAKEQEEST